MLGRVILDWICRLKLNYSGLCIGLRLFMCVGY